MAQICTNVKTKASKGKLNLQHKTESVQNKEVNSINGVQKKIRLTAIIQNRALAQQELEKKIGFEAEVKNQRALKSRRLWLMEL